MKAVPQCGRKNLEPSDGLTSKGQEIPSSGSHSRKDNTSPLLQLEIGSGQRGRQLMVASRIATVASDINSNLAGKVGEGKIQPLDLAIEAEPSDEYCLSAAEIDKSNGLNSLGLDKLQSQRCTVGNGLPELNPRAHSFQPADTVGRNLDLECQPPSTQSNFQPKNNFSEEFSPHEDKENSDSDASGYFDYYHSDGDFLEDCDWFSEDSEAAKLLKGKWRKAYSL